MFMYLSDISFLIEKSFYVLVRQIYSDDKISVTLNKDGHLRTFRKPFNNTDAETGRGIDLWHLSGAVQPAHNATMWSQLLS